MSYVVRAAEEGVGAYNVGSAAGNADSEALLDLGYNDTTSSIAEGSAGVY